MVDPTTAALILRGMDLTITLFENRRRNSQGTLEEYIQVRDELRKRLLQEAVDLVAVDPSDDGDPEDMGTEG